MHGPRWWKNSVTIIKRLTTKKTYTTFELDDEAGVVIFHHYVYVDKLGMVDFKESVTLDALNSVLLEQVLSKLIDSFRLKIYVFLKEKGKELDHLI